MLPGLAQPDGLPDGAPGELRVVRQVVLLVELAGDRLRRAIGRAPADDVT
jgi:hypothetical protein